jgi:hypothetical protein
MEMFESSNPGYVRVFRKIKADNCCKWQQEMIRDYLRTLYLERGLKNECKKGIDDNANSSS